MIPVQATHWGSSNPRANILSWLTEGEGTGFPSEGVKIPGSWMWKLNKMTQAVSNARTRLYHWCFARMMFALFVFQSYQISFASVITLNQGPGIKTSPGLACTGEPFSLYCLQRRKRVNVLTPTVLQEWRCKALHGMCLNTCEQSRVFRVNAWNVSKFQKPNSTGLEYKRNLLVC